MAKHNTKINASVLHKKLQQRWLYLDEHNLSGGSYQSEVELLESLLSTQITDEVSSPAMDGALLLRHFAKRKAAKEEQKTGGQGGTSRPVAGTAASPELLTGGIPSTDTANSPIGEVPVLQHGGYDGGIEVGFLGTWNPLKFSTLIHQLEDAKNLACSDNDDKNKTLEGTRLVLGDEEVIVFPSGGKSGGLLYKYRFMLHGVEFLVHSNPPHNRQGIRIRYTAEALIGNNFFAVHHQFVEPFLASLGFIVHEEKLSRVDFQVMVDVSVNDFAQLFLDGHAVTKFRKGGFHFNQTQKNGINIQTLTFGSISKVELCIYDKRHELQSKKSSLIKQQLFIEKCIGYDWWNSDKPITRIEFRLGREALKCLGVDSVTDLQECEKSILDLITKEWFRILESPKIRGHENKAAVHSLWERVRSLFFQYFSGIDTSEVKWDAQRSVSCDPQALEKQALGCLSKAFSCRHGKQNDLLSVTKIGCDWIKKVREDLYEKVNGFSEYVRTATGIQLGGCLSVSSSIYDDQLADGVVERVREKYLASLR